MIRFLLSEVSKILLRNKQGGGELKTLIYATECSNPDKLYALTYECAKYQALLEEVLSSCKEFLKDEYIGGDKELAIAYLYEWLIGKKFGRDVGLRKCLLQYKDRIKTGVEKILAKNPGARNLKDVLGEKKQSNCKIPRYMRVNLLKGSVDSVVETFKEEGWDYVGKIPQDSFKDTALALTEYQFGLDPMMCDVLVFPVNTKLQNHHLTTSGVIIHQDRASCVPAHVLTPPPGAVVLDCCAAPGNKTTHVASLMGNNGHVIALDRDEKRLEILKKMVDRSDATCVTARHQDFLTMKSTDADSQNIQMVLVDPSCSGTGMRHEIDRNTKKDDELRERVRSLKRFQLTILKHALRFPNVQKVVYSTCSVYTEENEEVATEAMYKDDFSEYFQFEPVLPDWTDSRGVVGFPDSKAFLRLSPDKDLTQGFFVACFKRIKESKLKIPKQPGETKEKLLCENDSVHIKETDTNSEKSKPKKKKRKHLEAEETDENTEKSKKKKRKYLDSEETHNEAEINETPHTSKLKKKKKKAKRHSESDFEFDSESANLSDVKKKKKKRSNENNENAKHESYKNIEENGRECEEKLLKLCGEGDAIEAGEKGEKTKAKKSKKKRRQQESEEDNNDTVVSCDNNQSHSSKLKKRKRKKDKRDLDA